MFLETTPKRWLYQARWAPSCPSQCNRGLMRPKLPQPRHVAPARASSQVHVLIQGRVPISSSLDKRKPVMGEPMRLWESEYEIPVHSPSSETVNEQLRRAESLPTDTREYMQDIHSVQGERGEVARMTGRGRESTKGQATTVVISSCFQLYLLPTLLL